MAVPQARHQLPWSQSVMLGLQRMTPSMHSLPMPRPAALVLAVFLAQRGLFRLSIVLVLQSAFGLRPSEALAITPASIVFPNTSYYNCGLIVFKLGSKTKSGRPESVRIFPKLHQLEIALLQWCVVNGPASAPISANVSVSSYSAAINKHSRLLNLPPYSGHSARAGFVSDMSLAGWTDSEIMTVTRHQSVKSFAVYQDNASNVAQTCWGKVSPWISRSKDIAAAPQNFFPQLGKAVVSLY